MCRNRHIAFLNQTNASKHIPHHNFRAKIRFGEVPGGIFERKIRCFVNFLQGNRIKIREEKYRIHHADMMVANRSIQICIPEVIKIS